MHMQANSNIVGSFSALPSLVSSYSAMSRMPPNLTGDEIYNHVHDAASITEMLKLFAGGDSVHNLSAAPASLPESALAVDLVSQSLNEREVYDVVRLEQNSGD